MERKNKLTALISLRFFFALRVFASHLKPLIGDNYVYNWIYDNVLFVPFGVSFFYILSGFVLSYSYRDRFIDNSKLLGDFYLDRFIRIYPLHIMTFLIIMPISDELYYFGNIIGWFTKIFSSIFLMQSFIPLRSVYFSYNGPSWSLSNALWFYAIFPFVVILLKKITIKRVVYILGGLFIVMPFLMISVDKEFQHWLFYINPLFRSIDFILGIILFEIYEKLKCLNIDKRYYSVMEVGSIIAFVIYIAMCRAIPEVIRDSYSNWLPLCLIIISFSFEKGVISKMFLKNKLLLSLGSVSFGIFIFHNVVIKYFTFLNNYLGIKEPFIIVAIAFIATVGISFLSANYLERNIGRYLKCKIKSFVNSNYIRRLQTYRLR
ncbi:acyltransferase family protein [Plebeiibacterium marinum]|uniref:Acyltransferase n=1 Tax=Plebeiibacterium marinum TaxID=2992111 RepID=A0AAE3MH53_9BACT|nr:acyltransferase [Plebeiobacterium marinum]MCW3807390.1 acyltransferase [Plebeiobacterium marinum]